jgi:hypothetical protein
VYKDMYRTKEMYGTDHSAIFSTRVTTQCTVHSITGLAIQCTVSTKAATSGKDAVLNAT